LLLRHRLRRLGRLGSGQADHGELSLGVAAGTALQAQDTADVRHAVTYILIAASRDRPEVP
jgi:hypothetical protein